MIGELLTNKTERKRFLNWQCKVCIIPNQPIKEIVPDFGVSSGTISILNMEVHSCYFSYDIVKRSKWGSPYL